MNAATSSGRSTGSQWPASPTVRSATRLLTAATTSLWSAGEQRRSESEESSVGLEHHLGAPDSSEVASADAS